MARERRVLIAGGVYHLFSRGSNRQAIFLFDSDRLDFLSCLERVVERHELRCYAYCLMPNHYHLVLETPSESLSQAMKALNGRYSLRFNRRYGRDAHLFKNRFGAVVQESHDQLLATLRYTVRNPVEASLCSSPDDWPWSSCRASAGLESPPPYLDLIGLLAHFGPEPEKAMSACRALMFDGDGPIGV